MLEQPAALGRHARRRVGQRARRSVGGRQRHDHPLGRSGVVERAERHVRVALRDLGRRRGRRLGRRRQRRDRSLGRPRVVARRHGPHGEPHRRVGQRTPSDVWAVGGLPGGDGVALHWDGTTWSVARRWATPACRSRSGAAPRTTSGPRASRGCSLHWNGTKWSPVASGVTTDLVSLWGSAADDVWAVGDEGAILHCDGARVDARRRRHEGRHLPGRVGHGARRRLDRRPDARTCATGTARRGRRGRSTTAAATCARCGAAARTTSWLVGVYGFTAHWDGAAWSYHSRGTTESFKRVWGTSLTDIWAIGHRARVPLERQRSGHPMRRRTAATACGAAARATSGSSTSGARSSTGTARPGRPSRAACTTDLLGVGGSGPHDAWAVGKHRHHPALGRHRVVARARSGTDTDLYGVWASAANDAWACGNAGLMLHWNGTTWTPVASATAQRLGRDLRRRARRHLGGGQRHRPLGRHGVDAAPEHGDPRDLGRRDDGRRRRLVRRPGRHAPLGRRRDDRA